MYAVIPVIVIFGKSSIQVNPRCYKCEVTSYYLKENTGMNWKAFAQYFDIPYRTVQDWYLGKRSMPDYLLRLMSYKIETEELHRSR